MMLDAIQARSPWLVLLVIAATVAVAAGAPCREPSRHLQLDALPLRLVEAERATLRALGWLDRHAPRSCGHHVDRQITTEFGCRLARWRTAAAWSAHANYFFEWCCWVGLAVYGVAFAPWGLIAIVPQAIILGSIFGVTGIPPTENQAIRSKGDAYRDIRSASASSSRCRRSVRVLWRDRSRNSLFYPGSTRLVGGLL